MKRGFWIALVLAGCLAAAPRLFAQTPAGGDAAGSGQNKPAGDVKNPGNANPFPEDTSTVPVMPSKATPDLPQGTFNEEESERVPLPGDDLDPVRSPDDSGLASGGQDSDSSSSLAGMDSLLPGPNDEQPGKRKKKGTEMEPTHQETSVEDISVGKYYLDNKNWRAALSRFQSAMVLAPDDPEVYWGLAESERHLGDFAAARAYYLKVVDYDPDSRHGKEASKALKTPEIANAKAALPVETQSATPR
jgi:hypothetical protein